MKRLLLIAVLYLTATAGVLGQAPFFQHYSLLKKNESVFVNCLFQDHAGFLWYGTNKGLFKFNGSKFSRFTANDSIVGNITAIAEDSIGRIWIGQKSGVIGFLENDKWQVWESPEGPVHQPISGILFDKKGTLWFSTLSDGLYYFRRERLYRIDETNGMPDLFVYSIDEDAQGNIWAGTDGGVAVCSLLDTVAVKVLNYQHGLPDNIIKKVKVSKDGTVWMVTDNSGIIAYSPTKGSYKLLSTKRWDQGTINDFLMAGNQVWIASSTGIIVYDLSTDRSKTYNSSDVPGLTGVNALLKDEEGNIWAGSRIGALRTLGDFIEFIDNSELSNVTAVAVDDYGAIWWAGDKGLFRRRQLSTGEIEISRQLIGTPYEKYTITSLFFDTDNYLWAGFYGEGAIRIDPSNGSIKSLRKELRNGNVLNITGNGNTIWFATLEGAAAITTRGDQFSVTQYGTKEGLSSDYIYQVFIDSKKRTWFGTDGKGADMLDEKGIHHFQEGLNSKVIYGFAEDADHTIWVNVAGEGLYHLDENRFKSLDPKKPLRENTLSCLATNRDGDLVVMHDLGIDQYEVKKNKIRYFGDDVGIREKIPNLNATAKDADGRIYFGTSDGIVVYSDLGFQTLPEPLARIEGLKVLDKNVGVPSSLDLGHDENYVTINYLGLWYQNPENLFYQTKLENYDREWISSRDRTVTYSSLPPGDYIFRLRVSDTGDFSSAKEVTIPILIAAPFWQQAWFMALVFVALVVLAYSFLKYRERSLREDKRILEMRVSERTLEIQRKTEEIQAQNEEIHSQAEEIKGINENLELLVKERTLELVRKNKALEEYAFITAHNLRAPVASVLGLINLACKIELDEESKVIINHLQTSAEKLDSIVRSITEAIEKGE